MITLQELKDLNRAWNGNGYYSTDKDWESNYQIIKNIEEKFFTHYDKLLMQPQKGDIIEFVNYNSIYPHAQVESVDKYGMMYVCENGNTWTDGKHFSTSGGSFTHIHSSKFEFVGYDERTFWTWGCYGSGAGQGIYFTVKVKKFRQKDMKIIPKHKIYFNSPHYMRERGSKVVIMQDFMYIFKEFYTIKAFKEWADYVGLTYRKDDSGQYYANQFLRSASFWKLEDLPEGCKPVKDWSNGSKVKCFAHNDGKTLTIYRPNPNEKDVYIPMS
nr:MAG TPA_asm: protein of unknown function (DUF4121) [Caudoviricetes sp.]